MTDRGGGGGVTIMNSNYHACSDLWLIEGGGGGGAIMNSNYHACTDRETPALCEGSDGTLGCFSFNKHQSRPALLELKRDLVLHTSPQLAFRITKRTSNGWFYGTQFVVLLRSNSWLLHICGHLLLNHLELYPPPLPCTPVSLINQYLASNFSKELFLVQCHSSQFTIWLNATEKKVVWLLSSILPS